MLSTREKLALLQDLGSLQKRLANTQAACFALAELVADIHPGGQRAVLDATQKAIENLPAHLEQEAATFQQQIDWLRKGKKSIE